MVRIFVLIPLAKLTLALGRLGKKKLQDKETIQRRELLGFWAE
jgi:hypothetical protein